MTAYDDAPPGDGTDAVKIAGVVVPAHNEERGIARLLDVLVTPDLDIVVVCNGCTDRTADVVRRYPGVRVLELPEPSKHAAMRAGDRVCATLPRVYVDADVRISGADIRRVVTAMTAGGYLAAAPRRVLPRAGIGHVVRAYYDIWERLPSVRAGLFGRGVVALSVAGYDRIRELPPLMADDLAMSEAFGAEERVIVEDALVTVLPPKTARDLVRRRVRARTGTHQADVEGARSNETPTGVRDLVHIVASEPRVTAHLPIFLGVTFVSRAIAAIRIRRGDYVTWSRDESSRS